jgi:hypothetical protein
VFAAVLRGVDDDQPDPKVRLDRTCTVRAGAVEERIRVSSHRDVPSRSLSPCDRTRLRAAAARQGRDGRRGAWGWDGERAPRVPASFTLTAPGAAIAVEEALAVRWTTVLEPRSTEEFSFELPSRTPRWS